MAAVFDKYNFISLKNTQFLGKKEISAGLFLLHQFTENTFHRIEHESLKATAM